MIFDMSDEILTNAETRSRGVFRIGFGELLDAKGKPVKLTVWNLGKETYPEKVRKITNYGTPSLDDESVTITKEIAPIFGWSQAQLGTNAEYSGALLKSYPKLKAIRDQDIDEALEDLRHGENEG